MAQVTYRDGIAILQLVCFVVYLACAIALCLRHGFSRSSGWVILITFSLLRIIGSSFQLATINYPLRTTYGGALVCDAVSISPLTVLNLGLLRRVNGFAPRPIQSKPFALLGIASLLGIGIAIYGGSKAANSSTPTTPNSYVQGAVSRPHPPRCFAACAPLIAVRLVYALVSEFGNDPASFNAFNGNPTIFLCMSALEEIVAVAICVVTGLTLRRLPKEAEMSSSQEGDASEIFRSGGQKA